MELKKNTSPHIGTNIRKMRELRNYTQLYMAKNLGISKSRYSQLEQTESISTNYLFRIASILNTSVTVILEFDEDRQVFLANKNGNESSTQGVTNENHVTYLINAMKRLLEDQIKSRIVPIFLSTTTMLSTSDLLTF